MRFKVLMAVVLVSTVVLAAAVRPATQDDEVAPAHTVADLAWLAGTWTGSDGRSTWELQLDLRRQTASSR